MNRTENAIIDAFLQLLEEKPSFTFTILSIAKFS